MLTPLDFTERAATRFADNEYQNITEKSFRDFVDDIRSTFVAQAALNVPDYEPGRLYTAGFIIRHSFGGAAPVFLVATKNGLLPAPTDPELDDNWLPTLSPASGPALSQAGTVPGMLRAQGSWVPGRLYILFGRTDPATGAALDDVYVRALSAGQLEPTGYTIGKNALAAEPVPVSYDLATDLTGAVAGPGYSTTEIDNRLAIKAPLANPVFTGVPTAPTAGVAEKSEQLATTRFVQNVLSLSFTKAYPLVCVRASGESNFTFATLEAAVAWTSAGGPGSVTYVNRPQVVNSFVDVAAGTVLDLQQQPLDLNAWVIRCGNGAEIRNNRLLYSGRIAPAGGDGTPFSFTLRGGTLAGRINFQLNPAATCILDGVAVADFGQQQLGGLNVGPATSEQVGAKVLLRNGAAFSVGYPPHPNTVVTTEAPATGGGGGGAVTDAYTKTETDQKDSALQQQIDDINQNGGPVIQDFVFEPGYADAYTFTAGPDVAGVYTTERLSNVSVATYYLGLAKTGLPLTIAVGDKVRIEISRQNSTMVASVRLSK